LKFFIFTRNLRLAKKAEKAGIDSIILDWEYRGKIDRQKSFDLETNMDTPEDVYNISTKVSIPVTVRINPINKHTTSEIKTAISNGARTIMLPMAKSCCEIREFLSIVDGQAKTMVQIETPSLIREMTELTSLNWDYAYIGLNDLMVACKKCSIWESISDGTVERVCMKLRGRAYGFGGSTLIGGGAPVLGSLILHELIRLGGEVSLLRRTFKRELLDRDIQAEMNALREFVKCSKKRGTQARLHDHETLLKSIEKSVIYNVIPSIQR
jgi:hypothetical protein